MHVLIMYKYVLIMWMCDVHVYYKIFSTLTFILLLARLLSGKVIAGSRVLTPYFIKALFISLILNIHTLSGNVCLYKIGKIVVIKIFIVIRTSFHYSHF